MGSEVTEFLKTYWPSIMSIVISFLTLMIVFQILGVNFNPVQDKHIEKVVTIESFDTAPSQEIIKKKNSGNLHKLHETCSGFSKRACSTASYCILGGHNDSDQMECVGGGRSGPTYHTTDSGDPVKFDYFWYKGDCHGNCPKDK